MQKKYTAQPPRGLASPTGKMQVPSGAKARPQNGRSARLQPRPFEDVNRATQLQPLAFARSNLLFRKLQVGPQRIGEAVGQIGQADQQIEFNDLGVGKVELQALNVGVGNRAGIASELLGEVQRGFLLLAEVAMLASLQVLPVVSRQPHALRRGEMMLQAVSAAIEHRDADVHYLV